MGRRFSFPSPARNNFSIWQRAKDIRRRPVPEARPTRWLDKATIDRRCLHRNDRRARWRHQPPVRERQARARKPCLWRSGTDSQLIRQPVTWRGWRWPFPLERRPCGVPCVQSCVIERRKNEARRLPCLPLSGFRLLNAPSCRAGLLALAFCMHRQHYSSMPSITVRNVPQEVRDELAARAAQAGRSLQEHLRSELIDLVKKPSQAAFVERLRARKSSVPARLSTRKILAHKAVDRR